MLKLRLFKRLLNFPKYNISTIDKTRTETTEVPDAVLSMLESKRFTRVSAKRKQNPVKIEYNEETKTDNISSKAVKPKLKHAKTIKDPKELEMRAKFYDMYDAIVEMRGKTDAPVDTMGTEWQADPEADEDTRNFQTLVALILSTVTKDQTITKVMKRLRDYGLTAEKMNEISPEKLKLMIFECNFNVRKTKNIKTIAKMLEEETEGKLPTDIGGLLKLPGVGNKVGYLYLQSARNVADGIGVDTHVHRICNRLGVVKTKLPDETRVELQSFLKKELWGEINLTLVGFGQQTCLPIKPRCGECTINNICPEGLKNVIFSSERKVKKAKVVSLSRSKGDENAQETAETNLDGKTSP